MRVLVTGGAGFVGSHLFIELVGDGIDVICVGRMMADLRDREAAQKLVDECRPGVVIHCATDEDPVEDARISLSVARAAAARRTKLIYVSCADAPPRTFRALRKQWGEELCRQQGGPLVIARLSGLYGAGGQGAVNRIVRLCLGHELGEAPWLVPRGAGRSHLHVADACRALRVLAIRGEWWLSGDPAERGRYDVAGEVVTLTRVARLATTIAGRDQRDWTVSKTELDDTPILNAAPLRRLGWEPRVTLGEGLALLVGLSSEDSAADDS